MTLPNPQDAEWIARMARMETILTRLESAVNTQISLLQGETKELRNQLNTHFQDTAVFDERLKRVETATAKHSTELYGEGQMVQKVMKADQFVSTFNKAAWEILKPVFISLGVGLLAMLAIFGAILYNLQSLVTLVITHSP